MGRNMAPDPRQDLTNHRLSLHTRAPSSARTRAPQRDAGHVLHEAGALRQQKRCA